MLTFIGMCLYVKDQYPMTWESGKRNRRIMVRYFLPSTELATWTPPLVWNA